MNMTDHQHELEFQEDAARLALLNGDHQQAYRRLMDLITRAPQHSNAYFLLSRIAYDYKNHLKEVEMLHIAHGLEPENTLFVSYLARAQSLIGNTTEAIRLLALAEQLENHSAETLDLLGVTCNRLNRYREAAGYFRKLVALGPVEANVYFNLASTLKFCGDFAGAREAYEQAIALKPDYYKAHAALTSLGGITAQHNHIARLQQLLQTADSPDDALCIAHALSKELETLHRFDEAFAALSAAKQRKSAAISYHYSHYTRLFAQLKQRLPSSKVPTTDISFSPKNIFVVGMPRTGTTLVERILSSHSRVATGGELYHFSIALKRQLGDKGIEFIDARFFEPLDRINFLQLGDDYTRETAYLLQGNKDILIDKLPLNLLYTDLILTALPSAIIICLDRNPVDTIMSNYRQLFSFYDATFGYSLAVTDTARFYIECRQLVQQWRMRYPDNFYVINYEALVNNPESEIRRLLNFCKLEWEDACLAIENNAQPVATASAVQVRKPISTQSVGQWRHYEQYLGPVISMLEQAGVSIYP